MASKRKRQVKYATMTMADIQRGMQSRGIKMIKRDEASSDEDLPEDVDETKEKNMSSKFFNELTSKGWKWDACAPFSLPESDRGSALHRTQVFLFPLRMNTRFKEAKLLAVDVVHKTVQYLSGDERILQEKNLIGSKVSPDLVSKLRFHVWYKGDEKPINHTCYDEGYRDYLVDVLKIRTKPKFDFVCLHKGEMQLKKGTFSRQEIFVRVVNGRVLIYNSKRAEFPSEVWSIMDAMPKGSGSSLKFKTKERKIQLQCKNKKERRLWEEVLAVAKKRATHEMTLLGQHILYWRTHTLLTSSSSHRLLGKKDFGSTPMRGFSSQTLKRGINMEALRKKYATMVMERTPRAEGEEKEELKPKLELHSAKEDREGSRGASRREKFAQQEAEEKVQEDQQELKLERRLEEESAKEEEEEGRPENSLEIEVRVVNKGKEVPIGFIETEVGVELSSLREQIVAELDKIPPKWVFLRCGVPVGRRQEQKKSLDYIEEESIVRIRPSVQRRGGRGTQQ